MTKYSYCIQYGKPKFFKNGEHMTESEILNEMEVKEILLKQWIDEANRLSDENERFKADNNRLINETAKIVAEHQGKVLDLIDDKIDKLEKRYKFGQEVYHCCPMHNIRFGINVLKELKKELQE